METSNAAIVRDELALLPKSLELSGRAYRVVRVNLSVAAVVFAVLVTWDVLWLLSLPPGVAGHESFTVVVALSGLRPLRRSAWNRAVPP